jgi:hypothetical protein
MNKSMLVFELLLVGLAAGCSSNPVASDPAHAPVASRDAADRAYLLDSAAADFREHGPATSGFRKVRYGVVEGAGGGGMPILCGEFHTAQKPEEWTKFATLKTSKYEQWIGDKGFCERPAFSWDPDDLSGELEKRVDALR